MEKEKHPDTAFAHISLGNIVKKNWRVVCIFGIALMITYGISLRNGFVSDDVGAIVQNPQLANLFFHLTHSPPGTILLSFLYVTVGKTVFFYHLLNIFFHFLTTILVFFFVCLVAKRKDVAFITALLFAIHPIHTEAVSWISALPYLAYSLFSLVSLILFIFIDEKRLSRKWLVPFSISLYLAYTSSEKAIMLPVLFLSYGVILSKWKRNIYSFICVSMVTAWYAIGLIGRFGTRLTSVNPNPDTPRIIFNPLLQLPVALSTYLKLFFIPTELSFYHEFILQPLDVWVDIIITSIFIIFVLFLLRINKRLFFFALFFLIGLSPTLLPIKIGWLVAERYVYLPSLGIFALFGYALAYVQKKNNHLFLLVFFIVAVACTFFTIRRNTQWFNEDTLWQATVTTIPNSSKAHNNMGGYYYKKGDKEGAIREFTTAMNLNPENADPAFNLGNIYFEMGESTKAAQFFEKTLTIDPSLLDPTLGLAIIYFRLGNTSKAIEYLGKAKLTNVETPSDYNSWGVYFMEVGEKDMAVKMFENALSLDSNYAPAKQGMATLKKQ